MKRGIGFLMLAGCVILMTGCDSDEGKQNYEFFKNHPAQARTVIGECRLNGTRGMDSKRNAVCEAAVAADKSTQYEESLNPK
ncbi:MAG TPA: EexN family lipoprotein [Herbaspirillum sp.]|jgi:hypothetical protein|nr:EexN family lipoprotein [Herbaspirillum sp.]